MVFSRIATIMVLLFGLVFVVGIAILQVFLSKKPSKWPGLVLPGLSLLFAILTVLGVVFYMAVPPGGDSVLSEIFASSLLFFLLSNVPTIILLAIYFVCRSGSKHQLDLAKMQAQDLE